MEILFQKATSGHKLAMKLSNGTHLHQLGDFPLITYNQWHHLGIVYSTNYGFEVYHDGCMHMYTLVKTTAKIPTIRSFRLGCDYSRNCMTMGFDDLRFWTTRKPQLFMWWLWTM